MSLRSPQGSSPQLGGDSYLYLSSNNGTQNPETSTDQRSKTIDQKSFLSPYHKKQAHVIFDNSQRFIKRVGLENIGFLTLTFKDNVTDNKEATRRFKSLNTHFLSEYFGDWGWVKEVQKRGAWHYHILIDCKTDIRTGFDWESYLMAQHIRERGFKAGLKYRDYKKILRPFERKYITTAPPALRKIWTLMKQMGKYGFGRCELLPIRSTVEATARYVGKYVANHVGNRLEAHKGVRLSSYSKNCIRSSTKMAWNNDNSKKWRKNLSIFAGYFGCKNLDHMKKRFGPRWAYHFQELIIDIKKYTQKQIFQFVYSNPPSQEPPAPAKKKIHIPKGNLIHDDLLIDQRTGEILF